MIDPILRKVARAIEARYPGTKVEIEPFHDPDGDRMFRWILRVLGVQRRDLEAVPDFADDLARRLYGRWLLPYLVETIERRRTSRFLAERAAERERFRRARRRLLASWRSRHPGRRRGRLRRRAVG